MDATAQSERVGIRLKRIRERLGLSGLRARRSRGTQRGSLRRKNRIQITSFRADGSAQHRKRNVHTERRCKQYTLGAIYNVHWSSIFSAFGCNISDFGRDQAMFAPSKTQLATRVSDADETIVVPLKSDSDNSSSTAPSLLAKLGQNMGRGSGPADSAS